MKILLLLGVLLFQSCVFDRLNQVNTVTICGKIRGLKTSPNERVKASIYVSLRVPLNGVSRGFNRHQPTVIEDDVVSCAIMDIRDEFDIPLAKLKSIGLNKNNTIDLLNLNLGELYRAKLSNLQVNVNGKSIDGRIVKARINNRHLRLDLDFDVNKPRLDLSKTFKDLKYLLDNQEEEVLSIQIKDEYKRDPKPIINKYEELKTTSLMSNYTK